MKNIKYIIWGILVAIISFLFGFLIRQPSINKLRAECKSLIKNQKRILEMFQKNKSDYRNLLAQYKALKVIHFSQRKNTRNVAEESLVLQYALKEYLFILISQTENKRDLTKSEILFFKSYEKVVDGKEMKLKDKVNIANHIKFKYQKALNKLEEIDDSDMTCLFNKLECVN